MKGVYNLRPPVPRYNEMWDADIVLTFLKHMYPAKKLPLLQLSMKLAVLILLVSGRRGQILQSLSIDNMTTGRSKIVFNIPANLAKEGRQGYKVQPLTLKKFTDKRLCVYNYMQVYLNRTLELRGNVKQVFITTKKPHKAVTRDTFSRWVKQMLTEAGIDMTLFKPGSTRSAATSKAFKNGATIDEILTGGGWSRESTFTKWYKRPVTKNKILEDYVLKGQN